MNNKDRNKKLIQKGLISDNAIKEIDPDLYKNLGQHKLTLKEAKEKFEKNMDEVKKNGLLSLL